MNPRDQRQSDSGFVSNFIPFEKRAIATRKRALCRLVRFSIGLELARSVELRSVELRSAVHRRALCEVRGHRVVHIAHCHL